MTQWAITVHDQGQKSLRLGAAQLAVRFLTCNEGIEQDAVGIHVHRGIGRGEPSAVTAKAAGEFFAFDQLRSHCVHKYMQRT